MLNADLKIRAIPSDTLEAILEMVREEAKDTRVNVWQTAEEPDYVPRGSYAERGFR